MNGSVFFKGGYMNRVGFEILARTPVPKLPQSYRPLPQGLIRMCYCSRTVDPALDSPAIEG